MEATLLELERESLKEINCIAYFVLGEGVCNIFVLIHVAANSYFICSRVTIAKCPCWELSPGTSLYSLLDEAVRGSAAAAAQKKES